MSCMTFRYFFARTNTVNGGAGLLIFGKCNCMHIQTDFFPFKTSLTYSLDKVLYDPTSGWNKIHISLDCKHVCIDVTVSLILSISTISSLMYDKRGFGSTCKHTYYHVLAPLWDWSQAEVFLSFQCKIAFAHIFLFPGKRGPFSTSPLPVGCTLFLSSPSTLPPR